MTVRIYQSTDASAPVLTGQVGKLTDLLDAVLVNGYGSKTAAGWTIPYTGTNLRQYAMAAGGTSCQLYVNDAGPGAGAAKEARINGFKTGTAIGAGTGQFPSTGQMTAPSGALVVRKSTTADATARAWTIIADGHTIYCFIATGDQTAPIMTYAWMFGDFFSYSSTDTSNCAIVARTIENSALAMVGNGVPTTQCYEPFPILSAVGTGLLSNTVFGCYAAANFTNIGSSLAIGQHTDYTKMCMNASATVIYPQLGRLGALTGGNAAETAWVTSFPYPNASDSGLYVAPIWIHHGGIIRGYFKGLWAPLQHLPLGHGDTYSGSGNLAGKSLIAQSLLSMSHTQAPTHAPGQVHIEYSDTWS